jgi:predicted O-methyltransferase YrrM
VAAESAVCSQYTAPPAKDVAMDVIHYIEGMRNETQVVQLMQLIDKLPGFLTLEEGYTLFKLAETWPVEGDTIEIGSFKGRSTCFLGSGCRRGGKGKVIAVDHFKGSPEHQKGGHEETREIVIEGSTFGVFQNNINFFQLGDTVTPLSGSSEQVSNAYDGHARMLFIDGDHSYESTRSDYAAWGPRVQKHGVICFHDYQNAHYLDGVTKFIDEEILPAPQLKFVYRAGSLMVFVKMAD